MILATFATSGASSLGLGTLRSAHLNSECAMLSLSISCASNDPYETRILAPISESRSSIALERSDSAADTHSATIASNTKITRPNINGDISIFDLEQLADREEREDIQGRRNLQESLAAGFIKQRMGVGGLNDAEGGQH